MPTDFAATPELDLQFAHRYFAVECFNRTWDLIEKPGRTAEDVDEMVHRCHASRWHWGQRQDRQPENMAIAAWQLARVYTLAGRLDQARHYANKYLTIAQTPNLGSFHIAYAYEALARIEGFAGNAVQRDEHLARATNAANCVENAEDRNLLESDLRALARGEYDLPLKT